MKQRLTTVCLVLLFLVGVGLLLYPSVSDYWNALHQSRAIAGYVQSVTDTDAAQYARLLREAAAYNQKIAIDGQNFFLSEEEQAEYHETLDIDGSGIMGYIEIDSIGCSLPIYHGTDDAVLQIAVGHIPGTSLPIGGAGTHCVLSGHRGLPSAKIFTDLDRLSAGDTFVIYTLNEILTYEVDQSLIVLPSDVSALAIEAGRDLCTLVTCTPYGVNSHRLLVRGHRIPNQAASAVHVGSDALVLDSALAAPLFALPLLVIGLLWLIADANLRARKNEVLKKLGLKQYIWKKVGQMRYPLGKNQKRITLLCGLIALLLQLIAAPCAFAAAPEPDLSAICSLNIVMKTSSGTAVPEGEIALYHVANWVRDEDRLIWEYTDPYASCSIPIDGLEDNANASPLARYTRQRSIAGAESAIDGDGSARFQDLSAGLYLIIQTKAAPGYEVIVPFLVVLPLYSEPDGQYLYNVTAAPKIEPEFDDEPDTPSTPTPPGHTPTPSTDTPDTPTDVPGPTPEVSAPPSETPANPSETPAAPVPSGPGSDTPPDRPGNTPPSGGVDRLPQTGQLWWPIPALALSGLVMLILSWALRDKQSRDE
jgi:sortase A